MHAASMLQTGSSSYCHSPDAVVSVGTANNPWGEVGGQYLKEHREQNQNITNKTHTEKVINRCAQTKILFDNFLKKMKIKPK